jgi:hypothetical protein
LKNGQLVCKGVWDFLQGEKPKCCSNETSPNGLEAGNRVRERIPNLIRRKLAGGNGTHRVEIVREDHIGLPGATVLVNLTGGSVGSCVYSALPALFTLEANKTYYLVSWETAIGDWW